MLELGLILALMSAPDAANRRWCRSLARTIIMHAEGKPGRTAHAICEELINRRDSTYIDDAELDDCFDLLRLCAPPKLQK